MPLKLDFAPMSTSAKGVLVVFCDEGLKFGSATRQALAATGDLVTRAAAAERFKGKKSAALDIVAPAGLEVSRLVIMGVGKLRDLKTSDFVKLGGVAMGKVPRAAADVTIMADLPGGALKPEQVAEMALGVRLRAYTFDRYKTKRKDEEDKPHDVHVTIAVANVGRGAKGLCGARRGGQRRDVRARSRQRAGQRPLSGRIRAARGDEPQEARRRGRGARRRRR